MLAWRTMTAVETKEEQMYLKMWFTDGSHGAQNCFHTAEGETKTLSLRAWVVAMNTQKQVSRGFQFRRYKDTLDA